MKTLLISLILLFLVHLLSKVRQSMPSYKEAAKNFRSSILNAISEMEADSTNIQLIVIQNYETHLKLKRELENYLPYFSKKKLESIWFNYSEIYNGLSREGIAGLLGQIPIENDSEIRNRIFKIFNQLLKFSKPNKLFFF